MRSEAQEYSRSERDEARVQAHPARTAVRVEVLCQDIVKGEAFVLFLSSPQMHFPQMHPLFPFYGYSKPVPLSDQGHIPLPHRAQHADAKPGLFFLSLTCAVSHL